MKLDMPTTIPVTMGKPHAWISQNQRRFCPNESWNSDWISIDGPVARGLRAHANGDAGPDARATDSTTAHGDASATDCNGGTADRNTCTAIAHGFGKRAMLGVSWQQQEHGHERGQRDGAALC